MRPPLALLLLLLLPACGGSSTPTTQVNPAASPASLAPSPASLSTSESQDDPPCQSPPFDWTMDNDHVLERSDPHFSPRLYPDCLPLNDHYPWQPVPSVPFELGRTYTQAEQDLVTQNERSVFNATERWVTEFGVRKKELDIVHADLRQALF